MSKYFVFDGRRSGFDDGKGGSVSLETHLSYIDNCMGTPDCVDCVSTLLEAAALSEINLRGNGVIVDADTMLILK